MYEFAQKFAPFPGVVDAKLAELKLSYASQSVYYRITRLAFDGTNEDVRMSVSRYGKVIEQAAAAKYSVDNFRKEVERGLEAFRTKLGIAAKPKLDLIDLGRRKASQLLQNKTYPIKGLAGDLNLPDGEEVGLIAKIENGELVVYGLLPAQVGATSGALRKLGAPEITTQSDRLSLWKNMLRTLKLVTSSSDEQSQATYSVTKDVVTFSVAGAGAYAVLLFPPAGDFLNGESITLSVADWVRICTTLTPIGRLIETLSFDGKQLVATVDESEVPDLGKWFEDEGKPSRIGQLNGPSLAIVLKSLKATKGVWTDAAWSGETKVDAKSLEALQTYKPSKPLTTFVLPKVSALKSVAVPTEGNVNLNKAQLGVLKAAVKKLLSVSDQLTIDQADKLVRLSAVGKAGSPYSVIIETA